MQHLHTSKPAFLASRTRLNGQKSSMMSCKIQWAAAKPRCAGTLVMIDYRVLLHSCAISSLRRLHKQHATEILCCHYEQLFCSDAEPIQLACSMPCKPAEQHRSVDATDTLIECPSDVQVSMVGQHQLSAKTRLNQKSSRQLLSMPCKTGSPSSTRKS